jgi:4-hydroxy-tetrahydrodipicolinate synthase
MLRLASHRNIAGLKDCCADRSQSLDLLRRRPQDFAVLTGEDAQYQEALSDGADGGILASAHVETAIFAEIWRLHAAGERDAALAHWRSVAGLTKLLFSEPSPAPIKHWLWRAGLIDSPEVRLPMTEVSAELAARIDAEIAQRQSRHCEEPTGCAMRAPDDRLRDEAIQLPSFRDGALAPDPESRDSPMCNCTS